MLGQNKRHSSKYGITDEVNSNGKSIKVKTGIKNTKRGDDVVKTKDSKSENALIINGKKTNSEKLIEEKKNILGTLKKPYNFAGTNSL